MFRGNYVWAHSQAEICYVDLRAIHILPPAKPLIADPVQSGLQVFYMPPEWPDMLPNPYSSLLQVVHHIVTSTFHWLPECTPFKVVEQ